ncbi:Winged helix-turn-helix transcription repressor DNA-binding [Penicillium odoratum]|uniref:Winged helix-turn-helix transcription repressor DNA-binding n=1 Tax=Penicillium odoratum TaxID=1167516 RepID=UPI0025498570|nr:Winged helix-turn-helix transcription repressor DNA-binding [Penicillium odoratum]KAJ5759843.1 Winged helix-turn-helix transcription repressor DNA-binding [Penicillium odoratum]
MALPSMSLYESMAEETRDTSVRTYVDNTLTDFLRGLSLSSSEGPPSVTLRCRTNPSAHTINPQSGALEAVEPVVSYRTYYWPGNSAFESWRFTVIIRILAVIVEAIQMGQSISKRDIFYIDPAYFRSQNVVDRIVDGLAYTIGVDRMALNVEAAGKGLLAGSFILKRDSQIVLDAGSSSQDTLIPRIQENDEIDITGTRWVLIIEKEAVFHRLARKKYHMTALVGKGILITGKGYPDICTRAFVRRLLDFASLENKRPPPIYALVDGDPDGIAIMSTYKYGSMGHVHENARLAVPGVKHLGLRVSDIITDPYGSNNALLSLTARDRRKIQSMLRNSPIWADDGPESGWRVELQRMLMLNMKAEIELLYDRDDGLEGWIDQRMFRQV